MLQMRVIQEELIEHESIKLLFVNEGFTNRLNQRQLLLGRLLVLPSCLLVLIILNSWIEGRSINVLWLYVHGSWRVTWLSVSVENGGHFISEIIFTFLIGLFSSVMKTLEKGEEF